MAEFKQLSDLKVEGNIDADVAFLNRVYLARGQAAAVGIVWDASDDAVHVARRTPQGLDTLAPLRFLNLRGGTVDMADQPIGGNTSLVFTATSRLEVGTGEAFPKIPQVFLSVESTGFVVGVPTQVTTTGFKVNMWNVGPSPVTVTRYHWLAFE